MLVFHEGANKHNSENIYANLPEQERARVLAQIILWRNRLESHPETEHVFSVTVTPENTDRNPVTIQAHRYFNSVTSTDSWIIMALDSSNQVLGVRNTLIREHKTWKILQAEGNIEVLARKQGVASAIEAVHWYILQQEAQNNPRITELQYTVRDANEKRLQEYSLELQHLRALNVNQDRINELEKLVQESEAQRDSWLKLYGEDGKLGFVSENLSLTKHFSPNGNEQLPGYVLSDSNSNEDIVDLLNETIKKLEE